MKIAVQLYTLREACEVDFLKTLEQVAKLGYDGVEFAGFYNVDANILKHKLSELNLVPLASHTSLEELEHNLDQLIAYNQVIGNTNIVCSFTKWETENEFNHIIQVLNQAAIKLKNENMKLLYHNHSHEFEHMINHNLDSNFKLNHLLESVNEMDMELDTYWVCVAKINVFEYMEASKDKLKLVHIKDMDVSGDLQVPCALGQGTLQIVDIIDKAKTCGLEWIIVENDFPKPDGLTNIEESITFLRRSL